MVWIDMINEREATEPQGEENGRGGGDPSGGASKLFPPGGMWTWVVDMAAKSPEELPG